MAAWLTVITDSILAALNTVTSVKEMVSFSERRKRFENCFIFEYSQFFVA
jgi:hypothetical protein